MFVYLWTDAKGRPLYVGKGTSNRALRADQPPPKDDDLAVVLRELPDHQVRVSGPYDSETALLVEAALISALRETGASLRNISGGHGPKFRPPGVPNEKADRLTEAVLTASEVGELTWAHCSSSRPPRPCMSQPLRTSLTPPRKGG